MKVRVFLIFFLIYLYTSHVYSLNLPKINFIYPIGQNESSAFLEKYIFLFILALIVFLLIFYLINPRIVENRNLREQLKLSYDEIWDSAWLDVEGKSRNPVKWEYDEVHG